MSSLITLMRNLGLNDLTLESWNVKLKELQWRFMFEYQIPTGKIAEFIDNEPPFQANQLISLYQTLLTIKPYLKQNVAV